MTYRWPPSRQRYGRQIYTPAHVHWLASAFQGIKGAKAQTNYNSRHPVRNISLQSKIYNALLVCLFFPWEIHVDSCLTWFYSWSGKEKNTFSWLLPTQRLAQRWFIGCKSSSVKGSQKELLDVNRISVNTEDTFTCSCSQFEAQDFEPQTGLLVFLRLFHSQLHIQTSVHPSSMQHDWVTSQPSVSEGGTTQRGAGGGGGGGFIPLMRWNRLTSPPVWGGMKNKCHGGWRRASVSYQLGQCEWWLLSGPVLHDCLLS